MPVNLFNFSKSVYMHNFKFIGAMASFVFSKEEEKMRSIIWQICEIMFT